MRAEWRRQRAEAEAERPFRRLAPQSSEALIERFLQRSDFPYLKGVNYN
jgi:hypothetical protein